MMSIEYDQVGVLLGGMNECKDHARIVTGITDKVSKCAVEELYAVARGAGMTFQPIFNEHGSRNN